MIHTAEVHVPTAMTAPGIGQRRARQKHEKIDEVAEMELHRRRPVRDGIWPHDDERQQREFAEQQRQLRPQQRRPVQPWPEPSRSARTGPAAPRNIVAPCRVDNRQQAGDCRERDIARAPPAAGLPAWPLRARPVQMNGVSFCVAPTARAVASAFLIKCVSTTGTSSTRIAHSCRNCSARRVHP